MGPVQGLALFAAAALFPLRALACDVPDEGGNTPWRRAVSKVKYLPETETMAQMMPRDGNGVHYILSLDQPSHFAGRCWWPVEVRVDGRLWKRYFVTPQGDAMREDRATAKR